MNPDEQKTIPLLRQSGLTDDARRLIRKQQRLLYHEMEDRGVNLDVNEARKRNNEIYENVRFTREAVLDGENLVMIASKATQQVNRMIQVMM